ncbi:hypothetical protein KBD33_02130 [Candidatus Gracilibacteria bacterium]|nr:hypothetical protein [Candidatus Gracilibacteria bacterium]
MRKEKQDIYNFDDALNLSGRDLSGYKFIVFAGKSGSGKSSYISWLLSTHNEYMNQNHHTLMPHLVPFEKRQLPKDISILCIDELLHIRHFFEILPTLWNYKKYLIASHLPHSIISLLHVFGRTLIIQVDTNEKKISRYLAGLGYTASESVIHDYTLKYRATYTDLHIILETSTEKNFDILYKQFHQTHSIHL